MVSVAVLGPWLELAVAKLVRVPAPDTTTRTSPYRIHGVAFSGNRGISRVELRLDKDGKGSGTLAQMVQLRLVGQRAGQERVAVALLDPHSLEHGREAIADLAPEPRNLPAAMLTTEGLRAELAAFAAATDGPLNVNFFCHTPPTPSDEREATWRAALAPYYDEFGLDVIALVGNLRYREHRSVPEIHRELDRRGVAVSERIRLSSMNSTFIHCTNTPPGAR